jgi:hypothetical protein
MQHVFELAPITIQPLPGWNVPVGLDSKQPSVESCELSLFARLSIKKKKARIHVALDKPLRPDESVQVLAGPFGGILVEDSRGIKFRVLPFGTTHDMVVVAGKNIRMNAPFIKEFGIQICIIGNVANMKDPWRASTLFEVLWPRVRSHLVSSVLQELSIV